MKFLEKKLDPQANRLSPKMGSIVECIIQPAKRTISPVLTGLSITSDGFALAYAGEPINHSVFLGTASDLEANWKRLLDSAGLTEEEREEAQRRYSARVMDCRR
jgi:hypothetical protein